LALDITYIYHTPVPASSISTVYMEATDMEEMEKLELVVRPDDFPDGVRCAECHRELTDGEQYAHRLSAFLGDTPVVRIVCVPCDLGLGS
jgi:hypothetical protein